MHNFCYRSLKNRDGKVYKKCEMRHQRVKCSDYSVCLSNFNDVTVELLKKEEAIYHLDCYKLETNKTFIDRLRKRPEAHPNALALDRDNCNAKEVEIVESRRDLLSESIGFDKTKHIICQERGGKLRRCCKGLVRNRFFHSIK